jgi:hypothetical protein
MKKLIFIVTRINEERFRERRQNSSLYLFLKESSLMRLSTRRTYNYGRRIKFVTIPPRFSIRRF